MKALFITGLALCLCACSLPKSGANSPDVRTELDLLATEPIPVDQKYLELAKVLTIVMDEAAAMPQNAAAADHIADFVADNQAALYMLSVQIDNWEKHLNEEERLFLLMKLLSQPYATRIQGLRNGLRNRFEGQPESREQLNHLLAPLQFRR